MKNNIANLFNYAEPRVAAATILAVVALLIVGYGGKVIYSIKTAEDTITVTGSAKFATSGDTARWSLRIEARGGLGEQQSTYDRVQRASDAVRAVLIQKGLDTFDSSSISSYPEYSYEENRSPRISGYTASREIIVRTNKLDMLTELTENISAFGPQNNFTLSAGTVEYTVSTLPEIRVSLLADAIRDAKARAETIAKESGRSIGQLRTANSGVVQVLPAGGVEISDYGSYDTYSKEKEVMVTVRAEFSLR